MNVWYINSILGAICLEEESDALCGVHFCPDGAPELEPLPRRVVSLAPNSRSQNTRGGSKI